MREGFAEGLQQYLDTSHLTGIPAGAVPVFYSKFRNLASWRSEDAEGFSVDGVAYPTPQVVDPHSLVWNLGALSDRAYKKRLAEVLDELKELQGK
ncbi:hypothetical protein [Pseudomonas sp. JG-B]|uniref:hypothetical protein n=1 Tax=Pseudomonas sp. JG-B TaxID=2603214 RepID=UPI00129D7BBD|nr:hypothetical protein [Pseudomonas sp. JG-B]MRK19109.1 hypothetical protein [Pseudomonas sp. JG-B]